VRASLFENLNAWRDRTTLSVVARLDRAIQYSKDAGDQSRGRGVLDTPLSRGMTAILIVRATRAFARPVGSH